MQSIRSGRAAVALLACLLSACGGGDSSGESSDDSNSGTTNPNSNESTSNVPAAPRFAAEKSAVAISADTSEDYSSSIISLSIESPPQQGYYYRAYSEYKAVERVSV